MEKVNIKIRRKEDCKDLSLPRYATRGSSGMDLLADVRGELILRPGEIKLVSCGIYISMPFGYEAQIRPRSGLALKYGISLVNSPGTIDSDYRGLVSLILINLGKIPFRIKRGDRIAQMVIKRIIRADLDEHEYLDETKRSIKGFGHTGI
jgi:dUTP pyrophosphatase